MLWPEFNWSRKQTTRFFSSISSCIYAFVDDPYAVHYFGSMVLIEDFDLTECVRSVDRYAMPTRICTVVDGLNRLTIFAVIGCLLYRRFSVLRHALASQEHTAMCNRIDVLQESLLKTFSCEVRGARPQCKPIFVHGRSDFWGDGDNCYKSSASNYLAESLSALWNEEPAPKVLHSEPFLFLVTSISNWLESIITAQDSTACPTVWQIRSGLHWIDPQLFTEGAIAVAAANPTDSIAVHIVSFMKLFALTHTLLQRCCFTVVTPTMPSASSTILSVYDELIRYP